MLSSFLLAWYDVHRRVLPFRGTKDPYRIWVSEIMLQQTRTETVAGYYTRFLERFPDVFALANAPEQDVLKCWEGLGYYSRARNLHKAAQVVANQYDGQFPASLEALRALPGVGDYTAAAVASIAFDLPSPAMDGNLTRVLSRVHGVREDVDTPTVKRRLLALAQEDMPQTRCGDFNQALMDLGATVCVPGTPDCEACPLRPLCDAYAQGDAEDLPVKAAAKPPKEISMAVALITCRGTVWMTQRKEALLNNLWVYQLTEGYETQADIDKALAALGIRASCAADLGSARHVFTHRVWNMHLFHYEAEETRCREGRFVTLREMTALPIPTAMKAAREQVVRLLTPRFELAQEAMLPALSAVWAESWKNSHTAFCSAEFLQKHTPAYMEEKLRAHLNAGRQVYAVGLAEKTVGVMILDPWANELNALYLLPDDQGRGVGKAAVQFAVETLEKARPMRVTVLQNNQRAIALYHQFGFTQIKEVRILDEKTGLAEEDLIRPAQGEKTT